MATELDPTTHETRFNRWTAAVLAVMGVGIVVLTIILSTVQLHVRHVQLIGKQDDAEIVNQQIRLTFNRPLAAGLVDNFLVVEPAVPYKVIADGATVIVTFSQNLRSDTDYSVTVRQELRDVYDGTMAQAFTYKFHTRDLSLLYIANDATGPDRVVRRTGDLTAEFELYRAEEITSFAYKAPYLAVVQPRQPGIAEVLLLNTETGARELITQPAENAHHVAFSPVSDELFILLEQIEVDNGVPISRTGRYVLTHNLRTQTAYPLSIGAEIADIDQFIISQDGKALLVKDTFNGMYYLVNVGDPTQFVALGQFTGSGGFSYTAEAVVFTGIDLLNENGLPYVAIVTKDRDTTELTAQTKFSIDPVFMRTQTGVVYSQKFADLANARGFFELVVADVKGKVLARQKLEGYSLELPVISADDRFVAVEGYTAEALTDLQQVRVLGFQSKPARATIFVYDLTQQMFLPQKFVGVLPQWY